MTRSKSTRKRSSRAKQTPPPATWDERVIRQLIPWQREIVGILLFLVAIVTLFGLLGLTNSGLLQPWTKLLGQFAGWGAIPLALTMSVIGVFLILRRTERSIHPYPGQVIGVELLLLAALPLSHILSRRLGSFRAAYRLDWTTLDDLAPFEFPDIRLGVNLQDWLERCCPMAQQRLASPADLVQRAGSRCRRAQGSDRGRPAGRGDGSGGASGATGRGAGD
jgi:hypothetical protein